MKRPPRDLSRYRIQLTELSEHAMNPEELIHDQISPQLFRVTLASRMKWKRTLEKFAYYFKREKRYDFPGFVACETSDDGKVTGYLIANTDYGGYFWVGAVCFRTRNWEDIGTQRTLTWIWLHPYFRNQGLLQEIWPKLRELEGDFVAEWPLSKAMHHFLWKYNADSQFHSHWAPKDGDDPDIDD